MTSRGHGLALSLLLGVSTAAGAYGLITTTRLGDAQTKPEVISSRQIAKRAQRLDTWEASLQKALKARPPALPALNRYAAVTFVAAPGAAPLPTPAPVTQSAAVRRTEPETRPKTNPPPNGTARVPPKRASPRAVKIPDDDAREKTTPVAVTAPSAPAPSAPAPAPAPAPAVAAPAATSVPTTTLSVEQQCRQLLQAAENKSEQVKQAAEKQCEALKDAAERGKGG